MVVSGSAVGYAAAGVVLKRGTTLNRNSIKRLTASNPIIATGISNVGPSQMASSCRASSQIARCSSRVVILPPKASPRFLRAMGCLLLRVLVRWGDGDHLVAIHLMARISGEGAAGGRVVFTALN